MNNVEGTGAETVPLRFNHPVHGELVVHGSIGRSKLCRRADGSGPEIIVGTRTVNRLTGPVAVANPLSAQLEAETLSDTVTRVLSDMDDGPARARIARDVWAAADAFLRT